MAVKHWNTGSSAERYRRENEQASKQKNKKGATICECCKKLIYEDEFYLANDGDIVCSSCLIDKGDTDNL